MVRVLGSLRLWPAYFILFIALRPRSSECIRRVPPSGSCRAEEEKERELLVSEGKPSWKLFENEHCLVSELSLAPQEMGRVEWPEGGTHHLLLQVGKGVLQVLAEEGGDASLVVAADESASWDAFPPPSPDAAGASIRLKNADPVRESRSIFVFMKAWEAGAHVWRGEEVKPGRRFEEEETGDEDSEEERVLSSDSFRTDVGTELLLENDVVRVWSFTIRPGEDASVHKHTCSYFFLNLGESRTCSRWYNGSVNAANCHTQGDGLVTWIDCSIGTGIRHTGVGSGGPTGQGRRRRRLKHVHGVRNVGTTWFRQFIVEFLGR